MMVYDVPPHIEVAHRVRPRKPAHRRQSLRYHDYSTNILQDDLLLFIISYNEN